jgi:hypothetical protein
MQWNTNEIQVYVYIPVQKCLSTLNTKMKETNLIFCIDIISIYQLGPNFTS